jgi:hypothetical protein
MSVVPIWFEIRGEAVEMDGNIGGTALYEREMRTTSIGKPVKIRAG